MCVTVREPGGRQTQDLCDSTGRLPVADEWFQAGGNYTVTVSGEGLPRNVSYALSVETLNPLLDGTQELVIGRPIESALEVIGDVDVYGIADQGPDICVTSLGAVWLQAWSGNDFAGEQPPGEEGCSQLGLTRNDRELPHALRVFRSDSIVGSEYQIGLSEGACTPDKCGSEFGAIIASPPILEFRGEVSRGQAPTDTKALELSTSPNGAALRLTPFTEKGGNWLSVSPIAITSPANVEARVDRDGLDPDFYSGGLLIEEVGGSASLSVPVTLSIVQRPTPISFEVLPPEIEFNLGPDNEPPEAQTVNLVDRFPSMWTATSPAPGITITPNSGVGSANTTVTIGIDPVTLPEPFDPTVAQLFSIEFESTESGRTAVLTVSITRDVVTSSSLFVAPLREVVRPTETDDPIGLILENKGMTTLDYTTEVETGSGKNWLEAPDPGSLAPKEIKQLSLSPVDSLLPTSSDTASILIEYGAGRARFRSSVTIILLMPETSDATPLLSRSKVQFFAQELPQGFSGRLLVEPEEVAVFNKGPGELAWTADVTEGEGWIRITPGRSINPVAPFGPAGRFKIRIDPTNLPSRSGPYRDIVIVQNAGNPELKDEVKVELFIVNRRLPPKVQPTGFIFVGPIGQVPMRDSGSETAKVTIENTQKQMIYGYSLTNSPRQPRLRNCSACVQPPGLFPVATMLTSRTSALRQRL